jgi:hypothetical protein
MLPKMNLPYESKKQKTTVPEQFAFPMVAQGLEVRFISSCHYCCMQ